MNDFPESFMGHNVSISVKSLLCFSSCGWGNTAMSPFKEWCNKFFSLGDLRIFFLADPLQICQVGWGRLLDFQVTSRSLQRCFVWFLSPGPFKDIYRAVPLLFWLHASGRCHIMAAAVLFVASPRSGSSFDLLALVSFWYVLILCFLNRIQSIQLNPAGLHLNCVTAKGLKTYVHVIFNNHVLSLWGLSVYWWGKSGFTWFYHIKCWWTHSNWYSNKNLQLCSVNVISPQQTTSSFH